MNKTIAMKRILLFTGIIFLLVSAAPRDISWVAIGDSITYLNDHLDETGNRLTKGFLTRITEKNPHVHYINQGHNGWTSGRIAEQIEALGLVKADVYTVFLGTNDWWQGKTIGTLDDYKNNTGPATVYGAFKVITNKIKQLNPKAKVILMTPLQRGDFVYINSFRNNAYGSYQQKKEQSLEEFANAILAISAFEKIPVVDLYHDSGITQENLVNFKRLKDPQTGEYKNYKYPDFVNIPFNPQTDEYPYPTEAINMTYDGLHPSDKGHEVIANLLIKKWKGLKK